MKKTIIPILGLLLCLSILFLQPVHLIGESGIRLHMHVGKTIPLVAISEVAGGDRCYIDNTSYFWLSNNECTVVDSDRMAAKFQLRDITILYREEP